MNREKCPCCGYPTLNRRSYDEICILCDWQDSGYSEQTPETMDGGPNGDYSLEEARRNFAVHFTMYREKPRSIPSAFLVKKRILIDAYQLLDEDNEENELIKWNEIFMLEKELLLYG
ncbi:hypothetical protein QOZ98_000069 [Planomicrobium stackebrandtii]|uniref:Cysteine-rich CPCC domain-containing protein n=1 Tax=Planomicrobium stackebrandtii TaxID=253160 RepID=A0ABU0GPG2_9BACL|nr:CPCC family cysteine-rich protein [Planomicrobium stackebrandtii]MDQ0427244.1 hypothetical protein [Planomicrobium stackebrandtii]